MSISLAFITNRNIFHFLPSIYYVKGGYGDQEETHFVAGWLSWGIGVGILKNNET